MGNYTYEYIQILQQEIVRVYQFTKIEITDKLYLYLLLPVYSYVYKRCSYTCTYYITQLNEHCTKFLSQLR